MRPKTLTARTQAEILEKIQCSVAASRESGRPCAFTVDRVSSASQEDGTSLAYQNEMGMSTASRDGCEVVYNFQFIESASKAERPWFQFMLQCARTFFEPGDRIYFKDATRAARNLPDINRIDETRRAGIAFVFYALGITLDEKTHPSIVMSYLVQGVIGKHETDNLGWRISEGHQKKLAWRIKPGSAPWGFLYDRHKKIYEIDPRHEKTLRYIFDTFDHGDYTLPEFVEHLNKREIRNQSGKTWTKGNLYKLLTQRYEYHGEFQWRGKIYRSHFDDHGKNVHPLGLEPQTYYDRNRWLKRKKKIATQAVGLKKQSHPAIYARFLRCANCPDDRNLFTPDHQKGKSGRGNYVYYKHRCVGSKQTRYISEPELLQMIETAIHEFRFDGDFVTRIRRLFEGPQNQQEKNYKSDQKYIRLKVESLELQIRRLYRQYATESGGAGKRVLDAIRELQAEIETLELQRESLRADDFRLNDSIIEAIDTLRSVPEKFLAARGPAAKAGILQKLGRAVYVDGDAAIFDWREPFSFLADDGIFLALTPPRNRGKGWKSGGLIRAVRQPSPNNRPFSHPEHIAGGEQTLRCSKSFLSAEKGGFEPPVGLTLHLLSKQAP